MASKAVSSVAFLLLLNLILFTFVTSTDATKCPKDSLKLGACANVLRNVANVALGTVPTTPCCALINGLVDLEAAACLCTAIRVNLLGINLNVPLSLSLVLNDCGNKLPSGFQCP